MRSREVKKFLWDVEEACSLLLRFTEGRSLEQFLGDELLRSAVERQAEIIGEALKQAADLDPSLSAHVHDLRAIIALRNRLVHGYRDISPEIVWSIAAEDVPRLLREVRALMDEP
jgi:uncharacterized protein with HEPN domain